MKNRIVALGTLLTAIVMQSFSFGQVDKDIVNWYNGKKGMQTEKAYKMVKNRKSTTVVVAVIDSGIDIEHEDLKGQIWTNEDEIPGNGIDDDNNGYIDDVHGWNFLGNANGENANDIRLEMTRIYSELGKKYGTMPVNITSDEEAKEYELYLEVKEQVESAREGAQKTLDMINQFMSMADEARKKQLEGAIEHFETQLNIHYNPDFNGRAVVGDDPNDFSDVNYGNNDVEGPDAFHGTHVGGIIGAVRGNELGGDGVATNVKLMSLRAVPNGDEFDKDIALAIRYAVDNGAQIINMSFGKAYSPNAKEVMEAFQYADSKGVLCVHAAGNDNKNIDEEPNYPTENYEGQTTPFTHFITIGASTRYHKMVKIVDIDAMAKGDQAKKAELAQKYSTAGNDLAASFSNYGKEVDVFAPGLEIYNTIPDNKYAAIQGTSMACPMVSGAAAFLKSYFPEMTMEEIKDVLLETADVHTGELHVKPGGKHYGNYEMQPDMVDFGTLSETGATINLAAAVKKCLEIEKSK